MSPFYFACLIVPLLQTRLYYCRQYIYYHKFNHTAYIHEKFPLCFVKCVGQMFIIQNFSMKFLFFFQKMIRDFSSMQIRGKLDPYVPS